MHFRVAVVEDIPAINRLYEELFSDMAALQPYYLKSASQSNMYLINILLSTMADILIAEDRGEAVGLMLIQEQQTPSYSCMVSHRYAYLTDVVVKSRCRGQGIGRAFIREAKNWARRRNLDYVELNVLAQNMGAIELYARERFTMEMHTMRCRL